MVDVLNPEHTASKTLNTTLEANELTTLETQTEAPENNHHISAAAETQPTDQQPHELAYAEHVAAPEHVEHPAEEHSQPSITTQDQPSHDASSQEEEMDFGALLESFEHEQAAQRRRKLSMATSSPAGSSS